MLFICSATQLKMFRFMVFVKKHAAAWIFLCCQQTSHGPKPGAVVDKLPTRILNVNVGCISMFSSQGCMGCTYRDMGRAKVSLYKAGRWQEG